MRIQSDSVNSASSLKLQPVEDVLPDQFAQLDFDYLEDTLVELVYEPEQPQPYQVRIDLEIFEACDTLAEAQLAFADAKSELDRQQSGAPAMNLQEQARQAVQASRLAGIKGIDAQTQHRLDMLAYWICEAAGMSIADIRVELWHQERQADIAEFSATLTLGGAL